MIIIKYMIEIDRIINICIIMNVDIIINMYNKKMDIIIDKYISG